MNSAHPSIVSYLRPRRLDGLSITSMGLPFGRIAVSEALSLGRELAPRGPSRGRVLVTVLLASLCCVALLGSPRDMPELRSSTTISCGMIF